MKTRMKTISNPRIDKIYHSNYYQSITNHTHRPCADKKGLHCEGDKFGYVVAWEIHENKNEESLVR